ncbi:MAG: hypothetical protein K0U47_00905 [Epsilonproteobacteria bacterium]|nr:hypothetical protein [Campylobacterota bacterium]
MYKMYCMLVVLLLFTSGCQQSSEAPQSTQEVVTLSQVIEDEPKVMNDEHIENSSSTQEKISVMEHNTTEEEDENSTEVIPSIDIEPVIEDIVDQNYSVVPPHISPDPLNIAATTYDASFEVPSRHYFLEKGASFDQRYQKSGQRSIKLSEADDAVKIFNIPVNEGAWYIVSGYIYVESIPSDVVRFYIGYTHEGEHINSVNYSLISTSKAGVWEEFTIPLYIQKDKNVTDIKMTIRNVGSPDVEGETISDVWIDDVSIHGVKDSAKLFGFKAPIKKDVFEGSKVRVDHLGNFEIHNGDNFEPFFPLIIYPASDQTKWTNYKSQGFNTVICNNPLEAQNAVNAGLYWVWDLFSYGVNEEALGYERFVQEYQNLRTQSPKLFDKLLYFYWDNEKYLILDSFKRFSDHIKEVDLDAQGNRMRPIYMHLDFTTGNKNYYNEAYKLIDIQGAYANPLLYQENDLVNYSYAFKGNYNAEFANFSIFENLSNSHIPKSIFVINSPQDAKLENSIFAALARGGRGFAYWKDSGSQPAVETRPWWGSFPMISAKLKRLESFLRTPNWSSWELHSTLTDDEDGLVVGKRDFANQRCMIFASRSAKEEVVTLSTPDQNITKVYDLLDNHLVTEGVGSHMTLTLAPYESGVYCWE